MTIPTLTRTRLEKAANDTGFDLDLPPAGGWLAFGSSQAPLKLWLTALGDSVFLAALSQPNVVSSLTELGTPFTSPLPAGAVGARGVTSVELLYPLLRRAFTLSRTLPNGLLTQFRKQTHAMPATTEVERLTIQRVGQDLFRAGLLDYWQGRCAVTGLAVPGLLRASHIKPWADCDTDDERLDVFNGLLLGPNIDAVFDGGFVTVAEDREIVVSELLSANDRAVLGLDRPLRMQGLKVEHLGYLRWHGERVWEKHR
jgi:hypothetical protein